MNAQQPVNQNEWLAAVACAHIFLTLPFGEVQGVNKDEFVTGAAELLEGLIDRASGQTPTLSSRTAELIKIMVEVTSTFAKGALH